MANENLKSQKIYGKYIKDLPQVTEVNDTDDIIIEDSTPITSRAKLGVLFDSIKKRIASTWKFTELNNQTIVEYASELNKNRTYNFNSVSWTNPTYSITEKSGVIYIDYYCNPSGGVGGHSYLVATLPKNIAPNHIIRASAWAADETGVRNAASVSIDTDGSIRIVSGSRFCEAGFAVSYCIN